MSDPVPEHKPGGFIGYTTDGNPLYWALDAEFIDENGVHHKAVFGPTGWTVPDLEKST